MLAFTEKHTILPKERESSERNYLRETEDGGWIAKPQYVALFLSPILAVSLEIQGRKKSTGSKVQPKSISISC